jgi:hypothetical protein
MNRKVKAPIPTGTTKVLVLLDCRYGKCLDVVALEDTELIAAKESGMVDDDAGQVSYGESLVEDVAPE